MPNPIRITLNITAATDRVCTGHPGAGGSVFAVVPLLSEGNERPPAVSQPTRSPKETGPSLGAATLTQYLTDLAAKIPAPGGGAVAALHAAQGAALVAMVARYTTRAKDADNRPVVDRIIAAADAAREGALTLSDADAAAFTAVGAAYKLPKTDEAE